MILSLIRSALTGNVFSLVICGLVTAAVVALGAIGFTVWDGYIDAKVMSGVRAVCPDLRPRETPAACGERLREAGRSEARASVAQATAVALANKTKELLDNIATLEQSRLTDRLVIESLRTMAGAQHTALEALPQPTYVIPRERVRIINSNVPGYESGSRPTKPGAPK